MGRISLILIPLLLVASGCASQIVEPSAAQIRSPIDSKAVRLYVKTPSRYEVLGDIQTTESLQYGPNKSVDVVMDDLIRQAAAKGGNGVLLAIESPGGNGKYATYGGFYQEVFVQFLVRMQPPPEAVLARAIYVIED